MSSLIGSPPETGATAPTAPARQGLSAGRGRAARRTLRVLVAVVALGVAWALIAPNYPSFVFPTPSDVWASFTRAVERGVWVEQVIATLGHLGSAFAIVLVAGLPLGILIGRSIIAEDLSRVVLVFFQTVPTVVLIALALAIYGISDESVIGVTVAGSITYFLLNVIQGTRAIDRDLVDMARAYHANETTIMRTVVLPSVIPYFLAGARITLGVAWQITLFSEYLMGSAGIGFNVNTAISLLDTSTVFMWGLSVVALTLLVEYGLFRPVERRLTRHMRRA